MSASTGRCEDSLSELLERQQPGVLGGRVAFRDDMENSVNESVETGHDWRDLSTLRGVQKPENRIP